MLLSLVGEQRRSSSNLQANGDLPELDFVTVANTTEGYTASDLSDLVEGALQQTMIRISQVDDHRVSEMYRSRRTLIGFDSLTCQWRISRLLKRL